MSPSKQPVRISLIGMSGTGKSYWSFQLAQRGFVRFGCDDMIERRLAHQIFGTQRSFDMGHWLGFPYDPDYHDRERLYLAREVDVMVDIFEAIKSDDTIREQPVVIDTTGSVIHTGTRTLDELAGSSIILHLETPPEVLKRMRDAYLRRPRPVLWADHFQPRPNESNTQALNRCYETLLVNREKQYRRYAHKTLGWDTRHAKGFSIDDFLSMI